MSTTVHTSARGADRAFGLGLARAAGGAVIFGLPLIMTMEMWDLGVTMSRGRLALFLVVSIPLLVGLSAVGGFERTLRLKHDVLDAFVAYAVGFAIAALLLVLLGVLGPGKGNAHVVGAVAVQAVPCSIGALLAQSQLGGDDDGNGEDARRSDAGYAGELFLMATGAVFLSFNIAPTEEIARLAAGLDAPRGVALVIVSLVAMHAFVYAVEFSGQASIRPGTPQWSVFLRYTVAGYAIVLLVAAYVLWTFGRTDGMPLVEALRRALVLGLPGAVGAAAARLIL